jgi:hypothetical protein
LEDANTSKDDSDLTNNRYGPIYTERELLEIYQDLLDTQIQTYEPAESSIETFGERENERVSVRLINRLDKFSPQEPGTSQSHATSADFQGSITRCRRVVSQLTAILEDKGIARENSSPSPSQHEVKQQALPSVLEWTAFIRECVSTSPLNSSFMASFPQIRVNDGESATMSLALMKVRYLPESPVLIPDRIITESRIGTGRQRRHSCDDLLRP